MSGTSTAATEGGAYAFALTAAAGEGPMVLDSRPVALAIAQDLLRGATAGAVAARFHRGLARGVAEACRRLAAETGVRRVVLGGGVFQNAMLLAELHAALEDVGLDAFRPHRVPPGDGGLALGQAAVAAARLAGARDDAPEVALAMAPPHRRTVCA